MRRDPATQYRNAYRRKLQRDRLINALAIIATGTAFGALIGILALRGGV